MPPSVSRIFGFVSTRFDYRAVHSARWVRITLPEIYCFHSAWQPKRPVTRGVYPRKKRLKLPMGGHSNMFCVSERKQRNRMRRGAQRNWAGSAGDLGFLFFGKPETLETRILVWTKDGDACTSVEETSSIDTAFGFDIARGRYRFSSRQTLRATSRSAEPMERSVASRDSICDRGEGCST